MREEDSGTITKTGTLSFEDDALILAESLTEA